MKKPMSKSELIASLLKSAGEGVTRKTVKGLVESIVAIGHKELKKTGIFVLPGMAKFMVVKKPATKERKGVNPFTGQETIFKAKPARKVVKIRAVKAVKDAVA